MVSRAVRPMPRMLPIEEPVGDGGSGGGGGGSGGGVQVMTRDLLTATLYDPNGVALTGVAGTAAAPVLTIQGIAGGTPIAVSGGTITAVVASVGTTGSAVPTSADYVGVNVGGSLVGVTGTGTSLNVNVTNGLTATVSQGTGTNLHCVVDSGSVTAVGTLTNNNATPAATNIGALGAIANAAAPSYSEGRQVLLSTDLSGAQRVTITNTSLTVAGTATVIGTLTNNNAAPAATNIGALTTLANAADPTITEGNQALISVDLKGYQRVRPIRSSTVGGPSQVASSATSGTLLAANSARLGATLYNDSTQICYVKFGATASATSYTVQMYPQTYYEVPFGYTGRIDGIWVAANGYAYVTELSL